jgi:hypothetical protein
MWISSVSGAAQSVWLDELDVSKATSGHNVARARRSVDNKPLTVNGTVYEHGVGAHSPSRFKIKLFRKAIRFTAKAGIDDETHGNGNAVFKLIGDGKELWNSGDVRGSNPIVSVDIPLAGIHRLECRIEPGKNGTVWDHGNWLDARIEYSGRKPKAIKVTREIPGHIYQRLETESAHSAAIPPRDDEAALEKLLLRTELLLKHLKSITNTPDLNKQEIALSRMHEKISRTGRYDYEARDLLVTNLLKIRRKIALSNPLLNFNKILFLKKHFLPPHEGAGNHMCDQYFGFHAIPGGGLFILETPFGEEPKLRNILENAICENGRFKGQKLDKGAFLSPDLSWNGKTILFAYTEAEKTRYTWSEKSTYHIFKVNVDGSGLRQLTNGPWNDFDPCWMPDGRIVFISERRGGFGRCHGRPVPSFTLHIMNADGSGVRCLSPHETNEWHPSIAHDGTIVYTRWDYVDRGFNQAHHPWITYPDGRDARAVHGNFRSNQGIQPFMEMDVRAVPGSHKYVATAAAHHGQAYGSLILINPRMEDDDGMGPLKRLTPDATFPEAEGYGREMYASAWPLDEHFYLCVYDADGNVRRGTNNNFAICLLDAFGNKEILYRDKDISCLNPMPLRPRKKPPVLISHGSPAIPAGMAHHENVQPGKRIEVPVGVLNVYDTLRPFPEGTKIKHLRIVQLLPKTTPHYNRPRIGLGDQKSARRILGTVPVEDDGSAYFTLPAGVPVYFQAIDEKGFAVQSMRSATYVHEGSPLMCVGCHNPRHKTPDSRKTFGKAFSRPPTSITPEVDGTDPFSYPRLVQPVLDTHCVACHMQHKDTAPDLRKGDPGKNPNKWYTSIISLQPYVFYFNSSSFTVPYTTPGKFGTYGSRLYTMLKQGHHTVKLSDEEMHRLALWMDNNCDFFGSYDNIQAQAHGEIVEPILE